MKRSLIILTALFCFVLLLTDGCRMGFFGKVTGKVVEPERLQPLAGVKVMTEDARYSGETDASGNFTISGVEAGIHTLTCKTGRSLYDDQVITLTVRQDSPA